jgi:hypothetical protein
VFALLLMVLLHQAERSHDVTGGTREITIKVKQLGVSAVRGKLKGSISCEISQVRTTFTGLRKQRRVKSEEILRGGWYQILSTGSLQMLRVGITHDGTLARSLESLKLYHE